MTVFHARYRRLTRVRAQTASTGAPLRRCFATRLCIPLNPRGRGKIERFSQAWRGHSPRNETEIHLPDQEKLADDVETHILRSRQVLAQSVAIAAHRNLAAMGNGAEGASTSQLADLAYAYACLEGARHGVLPSAPPPNKSASGGPLNDIRAAEPPSRHTSGYTTR